ncbi:glycosyltransferase, partial [Algoriphagus sp.]
MKVSIITVTFNSTKTLEQTIESVANQDYPEIEYIIVDGG